MDHFAAFPMVILYEVAVQIAIVHDRRKARRKAAERAAATPMDDDIASTVDPIPEQLEHSLERSWSDTT